MYIIIIYNICKKVKPTIFGYSDWHLLLEKPLNKKEQQDLEAEQKKPITQDEHEFKQTKEITLENHLIDAKEIASRNSAIIKALDDGYTQGEIARYLGLSTAMISKVFRADR